MEHKSGEGVKTFFPFRVRLKSHSKRKKSNITNEYKSTILLDLVN